MSGKKPKPKFPGIGNQNFRGLDELQAMQERKAAGVPPGTPTKDETDDLKETKREKQDVRSEPRSDTDAPVQRSQIRREARARERAERTQERIAEAKAEAAASREQRALERENPLGPPPGSEPSDISQALLDAQPQALIGEGSSTELGGGRDENPSPPTDIRQVTGHSHSTPALPPRIKFDVKPEGTGGAGWKTVEVLGWEDEEGGNSSAGGSSISSGSSKDTAIVPATFSPTGYTALYVTEMPEVRFEDVLSTAPTRGGWNEVFLDPHFVEVCHPETIEVVGAVGDINPVYAARVLKGFKLSYKVSRLPWKRPSLVTFKLSAIRKGFDHLRFGDRTERQFLANEAFINSAYPAE